MECNKCLLSIDRSKDRYTICEGRCAKRYHAACVGLSEATVCALFTKNILWMCDDCLSEYCINRDADIPLLTTADAVQTNTVESDIVEMKLKIEQIFDTLATIAPYHQPHFCENLHSTSVSSPALSSTRLLHGTKISQNEDTSAGAITHDAKGSETFSLFLTNVDCRTTEEDVNHLVCECLDINDQNTVKIRKIVPKGRSIDELDFVSFKVKLDVELKALAMAPSTWPVGLRYREFEDRTDVWIPRFRT